ncbi:hypothetical protein F5B22DRAFT_651990 [Xylaria bambusicola]|uniref:uncharacterized protein n=1 Tax=Xylaria bambusicola TaxID=326684 RepID=UPI002007E3F2|nr:uncharacterized protein F5B22DRAFT_651990 [Xylaria bambusicola]KAI0505158.1 hypothetical protein F5B22DRAFT_651990 [Xylaria bambusicola]
MQASTNATRGRILQHIRNLAPKTKEDAELIKGVTTPHDFWAMVYNRFPIPRMWDNYLKPGKSAAFTTLGASIWHLILAWRDIERVCFPDTQASTFIAMLDVIMMCFNGRMERTTRQWKELLAKVGLEVVKVWTSPEDAAGGVVEAIVKE